MPTCSFIQSTFSRLRADKKKVLLLDGGTGEELFRRSVPNDRQIWSATAVVNDIYHDELKQVHASFMEAGSQAITTNSYGIVPGVGFDIDDIQIHVATAGRLARESIGDRKNVVVLGSLGPLVESYRPDKIMEHSMGVNIYRKMKDALLPFVDAILAETMSSFEESIQAIDAVGSDFPILISYTLDSKGCLRSGEGVTSGITGLLDFATHKHVDLLGILFNCAEPESITLALQEIKNDIELTNKLSNKGVLLGAYANRLTPIVADWSLEKSNGPQPMRHDLNPEHYFLDFVSLWVNDLNVQLVGGCCGITPTHIACIRDKLQQRTNKQSL